MVIEETITVLAFNLLSKIKQISKQLLIFRDELAANITDNGNRGNHYMLVFYLIFKIKQISKQHLTSRAELALNFSDNDKWVDHYSASSLFNFQN